MYILFRIEAWETERILGFRCGLDSKDGVELKFRVDEVTILAGCIRQVSLTIFDVEIVYQERWMSTMKYYLPITRFTQSQCHKITTILKQAILQKFGLNRHTPKVVLYGPKNYGGKGPMKIRTEQKSLHTEIFIAHLRGEDKIVTPKEFY